MKHLLYFNTKQQGQNSSNDTMYDDNWIQSQCLMMDECCMLFHEPSNVACKVCF